MRGLNSLRLRLMALIMAPLVVIACLLGYWRYTEALKTAEDLFDRSLLATTLAISRDVAVSGGDALSITTRDLMAEAAGGTVFYHVSGPDRAYITGYATPPVPPVGLEQVDGKPTFYESIYRSEQVRAVRLIEQTTTGAFTGLATVTVWQTQQGRQGFAVRQAGLSALLIGLLVASVALVVWFSVNRGLRPLSDLEDAIATRTSDDLSHIRRRVPREVNGIVSTLNDLFGQVRDAMHARDIFISNAAHQLRNPVAGMLALAEAAENASSDYERSSRVTALRVSAERAARLTAQLLAFETAKGHADGRAFENLDLNALVRDVASRNAPKALLSGIAFEYQGPDGAVMIQGDRLLLEEALENLIDNAMRHGPPDLTWITVKLTQQSDAAVLTVADDGKGLAPEDAPVAFERFGQVHASEGSGLGLAITAEVARMHQADLTIDPSPKGASVSLRISSDASL